MVGPNKITVSQLTSPTTTNAQKLNTQPPRDKMPLSASVDNFSRLESYKSGYSSNMIVSPETPKKFRNRHTFNLFEKRSTRHVSVVVTSLPVEISDTLARSIGLSSPICNFLDQKTINQIATLRTEQIISLLNAVNYDHIRIDFQHQGRKVQLAPWEALTVSAGLHDAPELFGRLVAVGSAGSIYKLRQKTKGVKFCEAPSLISALFRCSANCQSANPAFDRKAMVENARDLVSFFLHQNSTTDTDETVRLLGSQFESLSKQAGEALIKRQTGKPQEDRILYSETAQNFGAFLGLLQQGAWTFASEIEGKDRHRRDIASKLVTSISVGFGVPASIAFPPAIGFLPAVMDFAGRSLTDFIFRVRSFKEVGSIIEGSIRLQLQGSLLENNADGSVPTAMELLERNLNISMFFNGCEGVRHICGN